MPRVDNPNAIANTLPGMLARVKAITDDIKSASANAIYSLVVGAGGAVINGTSQFIGAVIGPLNVTGSVSASTTITAVGAVAGASFNGATITSGAFNGATVAAGAISAASVAVTGAASSATNSVSGNSTVGGSMSATVGLASSGARANILTTWIAAQLDPSGNLGIVSSSATVKQDFTPADMSPEVAGILQASMVEFRYIDHVEKYGDEAPVMLGSIAEYFPTIGLGRYVSRNSDGEVDGIQYAELVKPLIATIQHLNARLKVLEANSLTG